LTGTGFDPITAKNIVLFSTADGTVAAIPSLASATSLTVTVPSGAITGPVVVQAGGKISSATVLQVLASATSLLTANPIIVDAASTTYSADIYVPAPSGMLSFTEIGIGDPGTSISYGTSSVEVARGSTKQLVVSGNGISGAARTSISISGNGITLTSLTYQGNLLFVTVTVSTTAALGPRNVTVTNSNLDTAIMTGGLIIR
jgi:hypothetical protein